MQSTGQTTSHDAPTGNRFFDRMIRAAKLQADLFEEVEADKGALPQAMGVVVLSSVAAGIGTARAGGIMGLLAGAAGALIGWYLWALITYLVGTRLLPEAQTHADQGELLRTIGFASSPGLLRVFGVIPLLGPLIQFAVSIWMLAAMVVAVRQALDYTSTGRAVGVCLIGWLIQLVLTAILYALVGGIPGT